MTLVPATFANVQSEINRLFDTMFSRFGSMEAGETLSDWAPRVDVVEDENDVMIMAELPGLKREDISVSVEQNSLAISGTRKRPEDDPRRTWHRNERMYGTFKRVFNLPTTIDPQKVSADYRNGVLEIKLPKAEHAKPHVISVRAED